MTEPATLTLAGFLLARIDEDEAVARRVLAGGVIANGTRFHDIACYTVGEDQPHDHGVIISPGRVLAECEAKRWIVALHGEYAERQFVSRPGPLIGQGWCQTCAVWNETDFDGPPVVSWPCPTLRALAAPYADHPDFNPDWR